MAKLLFKYDHRSRGIEGTTLAGNTWSIENLDTGETILTDHIELKTPVSTLEKQIDGKGFGMLTYGKITYRNYPDSEKQFVVILPED